MQMKADGATRLDVLLSEQSGLTRSQIARLIQEGQVTVSGKLASKPGLKPDPGADILLTVPPPKETKAQAEDIPIEILYQDQDLAVVIKPCGMVVHPAAGNEEHTLVNALLHHLTDLSGIGGEMRPGIVHRLDKDTSGLLLIAKNDEAHVALSLQLKNREMEKHYRAIVEGNMKTDSGTIDAPILRSKTDRKRMAIDPAGREALTYWTLLNNRKNCAYLDVHIITGRTHQIRVHMASIHHPIGGDPIYGPKKPLKFPRLMLHAYSLTFTHPRTGERLHFTATIPEEFNI